MKRVLIVDDALELGRLLQTVFLTLDPGLSISVVPSAEEALLESTRKPLDLLVSDIRLPGMSGFDLVKKIRGRHPTCKVLFITGLTDPGLVERSKELKVEGFFRKPLDMTNFLAAARACLEMPAEGPLLGSHPDSSTVRTNPPDILAEMEGKPHTPSEPLSDLVAGLRQRLGAQAVFVLDERGRVVVQAGDVPALPLEEQWAGPVMGALSSGQKVARLMGDARSQHVMVFPGKDFQLVLAPAGEDALLVLLRAGRSTLRLALAVEEVLEAQRSLGETLTTIRRQTGPLVMPVEMPVAEPPTLAQPAMEPSAAVQPEPAPDAQALADFEALFKQPTGGLKETDVDAFWDSLASKGQPGPAVNPDVLSYDQARKLGLTPKDVKPQ